MQGKILDMNKTDAFIVFDNGTTMDMCTSRIPPNSKVGDKINVDLPATKEITNDKMNNFFI